MEFIKLLDKDEHILIEGDILIYHHSMQRILIIPSKYDVMFYVNFIQDILQKYTNSIQIFIHPHDDLRILSLRPVDSLTQVTTEQAMVSAYEILAKFLPDTIPVHYKDNYNNPNPTPTYTHIDNLFHFPTKEKL